MLTNNNRIPGIKIIVSLIVGLKETNQLKEMAVGMTGT